LIGHGPFKVLGEWSISESEKTMPPANETPSSALLDDAASAIVLIETDDVAGWETARKKFLEDAEKAPPAVGDCLKAVAEQLKDFKDRSEEERTLAIKEIQRIIQTVAESLWDSMNMGLPKEKATEKPVPVEPKKETPIPPPPAIETKGEAPSPPKGNEDIPRTENPPPEETVQEAVPTPPTTETPMTPPDPSPKTPEIPAPARVSGGKFLTFFLAKEEYGFEILKVHEIITLLPVTPVPRMPSHLLGVINLRGKIIPVVDLRLKLGLPTKKDQDCIIIVRAHNIEVGVTVDQVSEVANIADKDIEEVPSFGEGATGEDLLGIAKSEGHVRLLLDIDKVLAPDHLQGMAGQSLVTTSGGGK
jgi:purine-binding chemotaxis protein CheW